MNHALASAVIRLAAITAMVLPVPVLAQAPPPASSAADELFITTATEQEFTYSGKTIKRWVPGTNRLAFVWSDQPFAVHVPFQLETKIEFGRIQSKPYRLSAWMQGFGTTTNYGGRSAPGVITAGVYRFDGLPVAQDDTNRFHFHYDFRKLRGMEVLPAGAALTTNSWMPTVYLRTDLLGPARYAVWLVMDPRPRGVIPAVEPVLRETEGVLDVRGIARTVWSTNETLQGVLNFVTEEMAVDPSTDRPSPGEFGRPAPATPTRQATPGWKRTNSLALTLKQNGWQLRSAGITNNGTMAGLRSTTHEFTDLGATFVPSTFTTAHRITSRGSDTNQPPRSTDVKVTVTFPSRLLDHGPSWTSIQMQQSGHKDGAHDEVRYGLSPDEQLTMFAHPFRPDTNSQPPQALIFDNGQSKYVAFLGNTAWENGRSRNTNTGLAGETYWLKLPYGARGENPFSTPASGSMPGLLTADKKLDAHRLLSMDIKYWVRIAKDGPLFTKHVDFHALRLSDLEDNRAGFTVRDAPSVVAGLPDDGYFDWLVSFGKQREKTEERLQEIGIELRTLLGEQKALHAKWFKLQWMDMKSWPADLSEQDDLLESAGRFIGRVLVTGGRDIPIQPTIHKHVLEELSRLRGAIQPQVEKSRQEQAALIVEGTRISKQLAESADVQTVASRGNDAHLAEVKRTLEHMRDKHDLNRLCMLDTAGWHGTPEMQQLLDELKFASNGARELAKVMEAKSWHARAKSLDLRLAVSIISPNPVQPNSQPELEAHAARMEAMRALHEALSIAPKSIQARTLLKEIELELLPWIQRKLERDRSLSMAGFHRYLTNRGYRAGEAKDWWDGFKEINSVFWGSSPITLGGGLNWSGTNSTASTVADETILIQESVAKNQVSLFAIQRLIRSGLSLKEIRNVTDDQILERLAFQTFERKELDRAKARRICQDIHETFAELYDLRALASGDIEEFRKFIQTNYYSSFDGSKTWSESIGDIFTSPGGLLMFLGPSAVVKVNGKWFASVPSGEAALLGNAPRLETVRDVFATTLRLEELGRRLSSTRLGGLLADAVVADRAFLAGISGAERIFVRSGSRLAAAVLIYCGAAELAEESGVPGLRLLVDAIGALTAEEMAADILSRNSGPIRKLLGKCDEFAGVLAREEKELLQLAKAAGQLEAIQKQLAARAKPGALPAPDAAELKLLEEAVAALPPPKPGTLKVAGTDKKDDATGTLKAAAEALKKGDTAEAGRALGGSKVLQSEMKATLSAYSMALNQARANLAQNPVLRRISGSKNFEPMADVGVPPPLLPMEGFPDGAAAHFTRFGDDAVKSGKLDEALDFYRQASHEARISGKAEAEKFIEGRLALASQAQAEAGMNRILRGSTKANLRTADELARVEMDDVLRRLDLPEGNPARLIMEENKGSLNPVFFIKNPNDGNKLVYVFKHIPDEMEVGVEVFAAVAASKLGIKAPGCERVRIPGKKVKRPLKDEAFKPTGQFVEEEAVGVLMRAVEGGEMMKLTDAAAVAMKAEYAQQRVLRIWLGDSDGHFRNIFAGVDGNLWALDFGMGSLKKDGVFKQLIKDKGRSQKEVVSLTADLPMHFSNMLKGNKDGALYHWMHEMDGLLSYDEMAGTVKKIKELCEDNNGRTLRSMLEKSVPADKVDEALGVLRERVEVLQEALQKKFPTIKRTAALRFHFDRHHAAPASVPRVRDSEFIVFAA